MSAPDLKRWALFADLVEAERNDLAELLEARDLAGGETLFEEGHEADALVLVASGCLVLSAHGSSALLRVEAGGTVGSLALFAVGVREACAVGEVASELWLLRRESFLRFAEDHPRAAFRVATAVAAELAGHARTVLQDAVGLG